jgi:hypothetical protein
VGAGEREPDDHAVVLGEDVSTYLLGERFGDG